MTKKDTYEPIARQYYVESQMPVSGIAKRLHITEKTIHSWKKAGNWDQQRANFLRSQFSCYGSLYELVKLLSEDVSNRFQAEGELPDPKTLKFLTDMVDKLPKLKDFESNLANEQIENLKAQDETKAGATTISEVDRYLKGL